jgi:hypothetical protein
VRGYAGRSFHVLKRGPQATIGSGGEGVAEHLDGEFGVGHGPVPVWRDRDAEKSQHGVQPVAFQFGPGAAGELHGAQQAGLG